MAAVLAVATVLASRISSTPKFSTKMHKRIHVVTTSTLLAKAKVTKTTTVKSSAPSKYMKYHNVKKTNTNLHYFLRIIKKVS